MIPTKVLPVTSTRSEAAAFLIAQWHSGVFVSSAQQGQSRNLPQCHVQTRRIRAATLPKTRGSVSSRILRPDSKFTAYLFQNQRFRKTAPFRGLPCPCLLASRECFFQLPPSPCGHSGRHLQKGNAVSIQTLRPQSVTILGSDLIKILYTNVKD